MKAKVTFIFSSNTDEGIAEIERAKNLILSGKLQREMNKDSRKIKVKAATFEYI